MKPKTIHSISRVWVAVVVLAQVEVKVVLQKKNYCVAKVIKHFINFLKFHR